MKTLEQIKNDYAKSKGYPSYNILLRVSSVNKLNEHTNELIILVQKECLKNAFNSDVSSGVCETVANRITNENNIIK